MGPYDRGNPVGHRIVPEDILTAYPTESGRSFLSRQSVGRDGQNQSALKAQAFKGQAPFIWTVSNMATPSKTLVWFAASCVDVLYLLST